MASDQERDHALSSFKAKLIESREWEAKLKSLRLEIKGLQREFDQTEENIKALQSVGQIIGEVLKQLDDERCMFQVALPPEHLCFLSPEEGGKWGFTGKGIRFEIMFVNALHSSQSSSRLPLARDTSSAAGPRSTR